MNHQFLIRPAQLNQAFESNCSSGSGGDGSDVSRRKFLKRTGGATIAVFIASNSLVSARVDDDTNSNAVSRHGYLIKVDKVDYKNKSTGSNHGWDDDGNPVTPSYEVRKTLTPEVKAEPTEEDSTATCDLTVKISEWADIQMNPTTQPGVWTKMSEAQFAAYRGGSQDIHETTAKMKKSVDSDTGVVTNDEQVPDEGDTYDETENGIKLKLSWEEDVLSVTWGASDVGDETKTVEPVFHIKAHSITL